MDEPTPRAPVHDVFAEFHPPPRRNDVGWGVWVDVGVFAAFSFLNVLLLIGGAVVIAKCLDSVTGPDPVEVWLWIFAFPYRAAVHLELQPLVPVLPWLNPFIYGTMGWLTWRMFRLVRQK